jgi:hypothetical protein
MALGLGRKEGEQQTWMMAVQYQLEAIVNPVSSRPLTMQVMSPAKKQQQQQQYSSATGLCWQQPVPPCVQC